MLEIVCRAKPLSCAHYLRNGSLHVSCISTSIVRLCAETSPEQVSRTRGNHTHHKQSHQRIGQRNSAIISYAVCAENETHNGIVGLAIVCCRARIAHKRHVNGTSPHCDLRKLQRNVVACNGTQIQPGGAVLRCKTVAQSEASTLMVMLRQ